MSVDVEIYMSNLIKFFKQNPKDLLSLVPKDKEELFYSKIRKVAFENYDNGKEITLTQNQLIEICKELNTKEILNHNSKVDGIFWESRFGKICLN